MSDPTATDSPAPRPLLAAEHRAGPVRLALRGLGAMSTPAAATVAEALFCKTARPAPRPEEAAFLARAERFEVSAVGQRLRVYRWGTSVAPRVLLCHGWWSHAGRFASLAEELLRHDLSVVAFDAPGHGRSTGWRASMPEFAWALRAVAEQVGSLHGIVGHSLGGAATIHALSRGLTARRAVTLAAPADLHRWAEKFRTLFDLPAPVYARMRRNLERRLSIAWEDLDLPAAAASLPMPGLVVHDHDDTDVAVAEGEALAARWPGAALHLTSGLGHRQLLRDPDVIARVVEFVTGRETMDDRR